MTTINRYTRIFENFDEYEEYYEKHERREWITDIVEYDNRMIADAQYNVKNWKTAVKKLARATGWDWILSELECDEHSDRFPEDCDGVSIDFIDEDCIYIAARMYK